MIVRSEPVRRSSRRCLRLLTALASLAVASACIEPDTGFGLIPDASPFAQQSLANAWLGIYDGLGDGVVMGSLETNDSIRMSVRFDADSVRSLDCTQCLTIELDSLFQAVNVDPESSVTLETRYIVGGWIHRLTLGRFSADGGTSNVVTARVVVDSVSPGADGRTDISYILTRR